MDDAVASDNCGEVTIEVSSETTAGDAAGNYTVRTFTATDDAETALGFADHHRSGHHSAGVHLRPCRLHRRVFRRDAMDDATASDNCGEVTIEVSSETTAGDARQLHIVRTFTPPTMLETALTTQTITIQDTTAPEFTFVPADYTVECSDEMPMDDATASDNCGGSPSRCPGTTAGNAAGNYDRSHVHRNRRCWQQRSASQTITVEDTTAPEFTFVPADYTVECSDEMPMDDATASTTAVR